MKVLHVIPSIDRSDGGPSFAMTAMAHALLQHDVELSVATTRRPDTSEVDIVGRSSFPDNTRFTLHEFPRQSHFYKVSRPLGRWLEENVAVFDLVHIHALFSYAPWAAARAARRHGIPYVVRPLGLLNAWGMTKRRPWLKSLSFRFLERPLLQHAAKIHFTSQAEADEAVPLQLTSQQVILPLGIDLQPFSNLPSPSVFFEHFPDTRSHPLILFLSRIDPKKGVELLLRSFALIQDRHPAARLVLAGNSSAHYETELKALASSLKIDRKVVWTGFLGGQVKLSALAAADMFVLPSHSENFGIALLEAMASGCACICTPGVALAQDAGSVVVRSDATEEALSEEIALLASNPAERRRLGSAAASFAASRYSLEAVGARLVELYSEVAATRNLMQ